MPVVVGNIVRITAKMKLFGTDDVQNVLQFRVDNNVTADDLAFMTDVAVIFDRAYTFINPDISSLLTYISIDGQNISLNELLPDVPWPALILGANANPLLPTQTAACVFFPTVTPKVRTSTFLGGYTEGANLSDGSISTAVTARIVSWGNEMLASITANIDLTKGSFNPFTSVFTEAGSPVTPSRWRTQRRRRIGVGS